MAGNDPLPKPSDRRSDIPPGLEAIITKALTRKREHRYQNAREIHEALEGWMRDTGKHVSSGDIADYLRTVFARRIHDRRQLIETAMTTELTPSAARNLSNMVAKQQQATGNSSTSGSSTRGRDGLKRPGPAIALAAMSALVLIIGLAVLKRMHAASMPPEGLAVVGPKPVVVMKQAPALPPVLVIDTVPTGAMLIVDGVERGKAPQTMEQLGVGKHEVQATLEGYLPGTKTVNLERAGERVMAELALVAVPPPSTPDPTPLPVEPKPPIAKTPVVKKPPVVIASGKLTLKTTPWSTVYLGKKKLGDTPLLNVPLPAGKHLLRLVNPESNAENSIEVEIKSNETTVKKLKF
jgi:eukaryotic-like serine/threonine-protein kinase